jgi:hypothetical protein
MTEWKARLLYFDSLLNELRKGREIGGKLRFGRSAIVASDIAGQFYCEKKVEMQYLHGEVETEAKNMGTEAHEKLTEDSVKVKREQLWQDIYGDRPILALEMFLLAKYGDVVLAGKPDAVLFKRGFPLVVFEYKFSRSGILIRLIMFKRRPMVFCLGTWVSTRADCFMQLWWLIRRPKATGN